jgi:hypothetical protein
MTFGMLLLAMAGAGALIALLLGTDRGAALPRRWSILRRVTLILLVLTLVAETFSLIGFLFHPWAYSLIGHPTLTGGWTGRLRNPGDKGDLIFLRIYLNQVALLRRRSQPGLTGEVFVCRPGGEMEDYEVVGEATDGGSTVALTIRQEDAGQVIANLRGRWEAPALFLTGWLQPPAGDSMPVRAELVKGRKAFFDQACHDPGSE